jgi:hypothetical protein
MKSVILKKDGQVHTSLGLIFKAIESEQIKYNWLITDCVCYPFS